MTLTEPYCPYSSCYPTRYEAEPETGAAHCCQLPSEAARQCSNQTSSWSHGVDPTQAFLTSASVPLLSVGLYGPDNA